MKLSGVLTLLVVVAVLAWLVRDSLGESPTDVAARDTMALLQPRIDTVRDTIRVKEKSKTRIDSVCCELVTDTLIVIQPSPAAPPETVTVRAPIVERIRIDSSLIASYRESTRLDSLWHIQDAKLPHKPPSRYSLGLNAGYACNGKGCGLGLSVGLNIKVP